MGLLSLLCYLHSILINIFSCVYNDSYLFLYSIAIDLISRTASTSMDKQRKEHIAYEYLCHLEEAKK